MDTSALKEGKVRVFILLIAIGFSVIPFELKTNNYYLIEMITLLITIVWSLIFSLLIDIGEIDDRYKIISPVDIFVFLFKKLLRFLDRVFSE